MDTQSELSKRALNYGQIRKGLQRILLTQLGLYERLRGRALGHDLCCYHKFGTDSSAAKMVSDHRRY